jgi:hypothetical protein
MNDIKQAAAPRTPRARAWIRGALAVAGLAVVLFALLQADRLGGNAALPYKALLALGALIAAGAALPVRHAERVLLSVVTLIACVVLLEVMADRTLTPLLRPPYRFDTERIFALAPSRESVFKKLPVNGGEAVTHRINSYGYRGPELGEKTSRPRVVVYGDSFIHAAYSADAESFVRQLERVLSGATGKDVEVVNAGVSSYGPDQISVALAADLPRLRPDLVIVSIYAGNDYGDLVRNKMFRLDSGGALVRNDWKLDPQIRRRLDMNQHELMLLRAGRALRQRIAPRPSEPQDADGGAAQFSNRDHLLKESIREYESYHRDGDSTVYNTHVDYFNADVSLQPSSESARHKTALMKAVMEQIRNLAQSAKVPLVFMVIPHASDVARDYDTWGQADTTKYPDYRSRNLTEPIEVAAKALGVPVVNLQDAFGAVDARTLYFAGGDDHWNTAGQKLGAEVVGAFVAAMAPGLQSPPR